MTSKRYAKDVIPIKLFFKSVFLINQPNAVGYSNFEDYVIRLNTFSIIVIKLNKNILN